MDDAEKTRQQLLEEVARLRTRLQEPEETVEALRGGAVDALVISEPAGERVYLLRPADSLFRRIVEEMREGAAVLTPAGDVLYCNRRLAEMLRIQAADLTGKPIFDFVAAGARPLLQALLSVSASGDARTEITLRAADGAAVPAYIAVNGLAADDSPGVCLIATDLTEQKRRHEILAIENLASSILEQAIEALVVCDENGLILRANEAAHRLCGRSPLLERFAAALPLSPQPLAEVLSGAVLEGAEVRLERPDGESFDLLVSAGPWRDAEGRTLGAIFTLSDITRLKAAEMELRRANRAKDHFLATLSHELRTPLTPVLAVLTQLAEESEVTPGIRKRLAMVRRNVELEARLIDDVLDLTRITRGLLEIDRSVIDLTDVVEHALAICRTPEVAARRLTLRSVLGSEPLTAWGDPVRLTQVFWNLIRNAVKFTPEGGEVVVRAWRDATAGSGRLIVAVQDNGVGIDPEFLPRIFDAFEQGDARGFAPTGGLGLGLAISKRIVDLHGGRISAESAGPGQGATFRVELPAALPDHARMPTAEADQRLEPRVERLARILLVEDHQDSADALAHLLRGFGHDVTIAASVAGALELIDGTFDLLISDIGLPDGSGHDLLRQAGSRAPSKSIALSGYGMESDIQRSREAGFSVHLTKPVDLATFRKIIPRILGE